MIKTWQICKSKKAEAEKLLFHFLKVQNTPHVVHPNHRGEERQKRFFFLSFLKRGCYSESDQSPNSSLQLMVQDHQACRKFLQSFPDMQQKGGEHITMQKP